MAGPCSVPDVFPQPGTRGPAEYRATGRFESGPSSTELSTAAGSRGLGRFTFDGCGRLFLVRADYLLRQQEFVAAAGEVGRDGQQSNRPAAVADPP